MTEKFINKQDYLVETEDSSLNDTDCEKSSEDEDKCKDSQYDSKNVKKPVSIAIRKRKLSYNTDNDDISQKNKKSIHMENLGLTPCVNVAKELNVVSNQEEETSVDNKKVPDEIVNEIVNEISNDVINTNNSVNVQKVNNSDGNISNIITVQDSSFLDTGEHGVLIIDEDVNFENKTDEIIKIQQKTDEVQEYGNINNNTNINIITSDDEHKDINNVTNDHNYVFDDINITEPEVIIHEDEIQPKEVIEINDHDDSDVEITSCDPPKLPVKKSLESIIKASKLNEQRIMVIFYLIMCY